MKIRNDRLSYSAWRKFKEGPDSYVLYLMGLELRSPYAAAGKAYHQQIAGALMGGYDQSPQVDKTITGAIERGIVTTVAGVELHLSAEVDDATVHGILDLLCVGPTSVTDWKTGRPRPEDQEQLRWYLAMAGGWNMEPVAGYVVYVDSRSGRIRDVTTIAYNDRVKARAQEEIVEAWGTIARAPWPTEVGLPVRGVTHADDYPRNIAVCEPGDIIRIEEQQVETENGTETGLAFVRRDRRLGWVPKELIPKVHATEGVVAWAGMPVYKPDATIKKHGGLRIAVPLGEIDV